MKTRIKNLSVLISLAFLVLCFTSCDRYCMEGNGKIVSEYRVVNDFYSIENNTGFDIRISNDSVTSIRVDADENLLEYINTSVHNGKLIVDIDNDQCVKSYGSVLITLKIPELERVELNGSGNIDVYTFNSNSLVIKNSGSGDIDIHELQTNSLNISVSGSGDVYLDGISTEANYTVSGSGDINGFDMRIMDAVVKNSGSGDISCYVTHTLDVTLSGSGDVVYTGPSSLLVERHDTGSGDIYERD